MTAEAESMISRLSGGRAGTGGAGVFDASRSPSGARLCLVLLSKSEVAARYAIRDPASEGAKEENRDCDRTVEGAREDLEGGGGTDSEGNRSREG